MSDLINYAFFFSFIIINNQDKQHKMINKRSVETGWLQTASLFAWKRRRTVADRQTNSHALLRSMHRLWLGVIKFCNYITIYIFSVVKFFSPEERSMPETL